jgi:hypothetical protein
MNDSGWISIHRKISSNPIWTAEPFTRGQAWIDLLIIANHKPGYIYVRGNKIDIKRGQVGWSINKLSKRWRWSIGKVNRYLNDLQIEQQIDIQKNGVSSIISILKYNEYQNNEKQTDIQTDIQTGSQTKHRQVANNNDNNNNKKRRAEFFSFFLSDLAKKPEDIFYTETDFNKRKIAMWKMFEPLGYTIEQCKTYYECLYDRSWTNKDGDPYTVKMLVDEVLYYHKRGWLKTGADDESDSE